jgi:precorrin-6Y C5,15-methyltransferase (decarboxylating)
MGVSPADLTATHRRLIETADILVGGRRHLALFPDSAAEKKQITKDIPAVIDYIQRRMQTRNIVVLASGDPLYYGIGDRLSHRLGPEAVEIHPNISSVAAAFARIKLSWSDAVVISLHGRQNEGVLREALRHAEKIAVLTDARHSPARVAEFCRHQGGDDFELGVFERLGTEDERIQWFRPDEPFEQRFTEPNLVVLLRRPQDRPAEMRHHLGLPDRALHHQRGLITKAEVRAVTLSKLALSPDHVLWDLGAGSGSISVEAALFITTGRIIAVEKEAGRAAQIRQNIARFGLGNVEVVEAAFPECLQELVAPHRVFIGGGGKALAEIIAAVDRRVRPRARIVINTVLIPNLDRAVDSLEALGYQADIVQVQINRSRRMPWGSRLQAENPVWIVTGTQKT